MNEWIRKAFIISNKLLIYSDQKDSRCLFCTCILCWFNRSICQTKWKWQTLLLVPISLLETILWKQKIYIKMIDWLSTITFRSGQYTFLFCLNFHYFLFGQYKMNTTKIHCLVFSLFLISSVNLPINYKKGPKFYSWSANRNMHISQETLLLPDTVVLISIQTLAEFIISWPCI